MPHQEPFHPIVVDVTSGLHEAARLWVDGRCIGEFPSLEKAWEARGKVLTAAHEGLAQLASCLALAPSRGGR